jgi:hypothetical protein
MTSSCIRQTGALLRKNTLVRLRSPVSLALEIVLPLLFVIGMLGLSRLFSTERVDAAAHSDDAIRVAPFFGIPAALARAGTGGLIAVAPGSSAAAAAATAFFASASALYPPVRLSALAGGALVENDARLTNVVLPGFINASRYFASSADIDAYVASAQYGSAAAPSLYAAIIINSAPPALDYTIRMNQSAVPPTSGFNVNTYSNAYSPRAFNAYATASTPGPSEGNGASSLGGLLPLSYLNVPGFLTLQVSGRAE